MFVPGQTEGRRNTIFEWTREHSKSTFAQNFRDLAPCLTLFVFEHPHPLTTPPPPLKVRSFCLDLTLSPSISILMKFREKKLIMSISIFG